MRKIISQVALLVFFMLLMPLTLSAQDSSYPANYAKAPRFRALLVWDPKAEEAHVQFDKDALNFFNKLSYGEGFLYETTTDFHRYINYLSQYDIIVWLNFSPTRQDDRDAFRKYMENGGGWMGFHASAYNDANTKWPWYNEFLGCGAFLCNNWPPQCALMDVDTNNHPVTKNLPKSYVAPPSEFYQWNVSPRKNKDVTILQTLSPKNYPFGIKDVVKSGDFPVVWTNNKYRMIYLNMGHGDGASTMPRRSSSSPTPSGGLSASRPRAIRLRNEVGEGANHPLIPLAFHTVSFAAFISWNFFSAALRTSSPSDATRSGWFFKASRR